jgi:hypothetical protein
MSVMKLVLFEVNQLDCLLIPLDTNKLTNALAILNLCMYFLISEFNNICTYGYFRKGE